MLNLFLVSVLAGTGARELSPVSLVSLEVVMVLMGGWDLCAIELTQPHADPAGELIHSDGSGDFSHGALSSNESTWFSGPQPQVQSSLYSG